MPFQVLQRPLAPPATSQLPLVPPANEPLLLLLAQPLTSLILHFQTFFSSSFSFSWNVSLQQLYLLLFPPVCLNSLSHLQVILKKSTTPQYLVLLAPPSLLQFLHSQPSPLRLLVQEQPVVRPEIEQFSLLHATLRFQVRQRPALRPVT